MSNSVGLVVVTGHRHFVHPGGAIITSTHNNVVGASINNITVLIIKNNFMSAGLTNLPSGQKVHMKVFIIENVDMTLFQSKSWWKVECISGNRSFHMVAGTDHTFGSTWFDRLTVNGRMAGFEQMFAGTRIHNGVLRFTEATIIIRMDGRCGDSCFFVGPPWNWHPLS